METLLAHCTTSFTGQGGMFLAFFAAGLAGGFTHCLHMCGPFVACERMCSSRSCLTGTEFFKALGLPHHLGRVLVYIAMGGVAALISRQVTAYIYWPVLSSALLAVAGLMFLAGFAKSLLPSTADVTSNKQLFMRGILLGFMPCGLLYAALMVAATLQSPLAAMFAMLLFTIGTLPALLLASGGAAYLSKKWRQGFHRLGQMMMVFNGLSLLVMASRIVR